MKTYDYIIVFKKRDFRLVDMVSQLMLLMAVISFISAIPLPFKASPVPVGSLIIVAAIVAWCIYCYREKKRGTMPFYRLALLIAAIGWWMQPDGRVPAIVYIVAAMLEKQVKFPQEVAFDEEEIVFNTLPKKHYNWDVVSNVILKDGILTIDFKNNKLIQKAINPGTSVRDEKDFNDFCQRMLKA